MTADDQYAEGKKAGEERVRIVKGGGSLVELKKVYLNCLALKEQYPYARGFVVAVIAGKVFEEDKPWTRPRSKR